MANTTTPGPVTTWTAPVPRTFREIFTQVEAVGGQVIPEGERRYTIQVPRRYRECGTGRRFTAPIIIGRLGWYVRDGKNHLGGPIADVRRAVDNIREGRDPLAPRREITGNYTGRDRAGRFVADRH
jgi:hypothetical protein